MAPTRANRYPTQKVITRQCSYENIIFYKLWKVCHTVSIECNTASISNLNTECLPCNTHTDITNGIANIWSYVGGATWSRSFMFTKTALMQWPQIRKIRNADNTPTRLIIARWKLDAERGDWTVDQKNCSSKSTQAHSPHRMTPRNGTSKNVPVSNRLVWSRTMRSGFTATGSEPSVNGRDGKRERCK